MAKRSLLLASDNPKIAEFITAYFSETQSIPTIIRSKTDFHVLFPREADFFFLDGSWIDAKVVKLLHEIRSQASKAKFFSFGNPSETGFHWDGCVECPIDERAFRRVLLPKVE